MFTAQSVEAGIIHQTCRTRGDFSKSQEYSQKKFSEIEDSVFINKDYIPLLYS